MGRAPCCDKANVKKGPWSPDEDAKLKAFIDQNGTGGNWITLPSKAGLKRCGKSCRLRWINYLRPDIKHGSFTEDEEMLIYKLHANIGSRWSLIAAKLPGRTDNDIKNYWNTRLKKKLGEKCMDQASSARFQRPSPPQQDSLTSERIDDVVVPPIPAPCKAPAALNGLSAPSDALLSPFLKPQQQFSKLHDRPLLRDISQALPPMTMQPQQQQLQVGVVKSEAPVVAAAVAAVGVSTDGGAGVSEQLMRIESSFRSCISSHPSSHPSPASSCSGISTDRSTYAPTGAQCAESSYSECLSSGGFRDEQQHQNCIQDPDALLTVITSAASPTLLVHSSVIQPEVGRGAEVPALEFESRLADVGLDDEMQAALFVQDESSQSHCRNLLGGVKAEDCNFDRYDWWSTGMVAPQKPPARSLISAAVKQQQQQQQHQQQQLQQQQHLPLQFQHHRYGEALNPTQLSLDEISMQCYMKPSSWNLPAPSSCNGNATLISISDYSNQIRQLSWDNAWAETR
ncbi:hypothetical protein Mapa_009242 [Marchantia paleacea]|nr:hypothetical protein Mapa_009242 [Marchantia paleacea]